MSSMDKVQLHNARATPSAVVDQHVTDGDVP